MKCVLISSTKLNSSTIQPYTTTSRADLPWGPLILLYKDTVSLSRGLIFKHRIKSHLPFAGIIRSSLYSPRFQDKG